jgi:hypothetical protein
MLPWILAETFRACPEFTDQYASSVYVMVHDILHERADTHWQLCVSRYKTLRYRPAGCPIASRPLVLQGAQHMA